MSCVRFSMNLEKAAPVLGSAPLHETSPCTGSLGQCLAGHRLQLFELEHHATSMPLCRLLRVRRRELRRSVPRRRAVDGAPQTRQDAILAARTAAMTNAASDNDRYSALVMGWGRGLTQRGAVVMARRLPAWDRTGVG